MSISACIDEFANAGKQLEHPPTPSDSLKKKAVRFAFGVLSVLTHFKAEDGWSDSLKAEENAF